MKLILLLSIAVASTRGQDTTMGPETTINQETTTMQESTTMAETTIAKCDVNDGALCAGPDNLLEEIEGLSLASDCQAICQNHADCNYWGHYVEEGPEKWGYCQLYSDCPTTTDAECYPPGAHECGPPAAEVFGDATNLRPEDWKCNCQSGSNTPDLDECDSTTTDDPSPCADAFYTGWMCEGASHEDENVIQHIEHISEPSDCQAICQNHPECGFFSHYIEGGPEGWGHCFLQYSCENFTDHKCEVYCISGPQYPEMDDCSNPE